MRIRAQDFAVLNGNTRYEMQVEEAEALYKLSNLPYPDFYLGHCLDKGQTIDSFLIVDVSREAGDLWLELGNGKARLGRTAALIAATPVPAIAWPDLTSPPTSDQANPPLVTPAKTDVNIRNGPGVDYKVVGLLRTGQSLEIVGRSADSAWWQVSTPQGLGWVAAKVTVASNVDERVPVR
ncbi:MAG: SH3 domain-containing protein [Anaerolineae bacterium]